MADKTESTPDPRLLCGVCDWPVLTVRAGRLGIELARIIGAMVPLVRPEHLPKVMAMTGSVDDQVRRLIEDLPAVFDEEDTETP